MNLCLPAPEYGSWPTPLTLNTKDFHMHRNSIIIMLIFFLWLSGPAIMNETWPVIWNHYFLSRRYFTMLHLFQCRDSFGCKGETTRHGKKQKHRTQDNWNELGLILPHCYHGLITEWSHWAQADWASVCWWLLPFFQITNDHKHAKQLQWDEEPTQRDAND